MQIPAEMICRIRKTKMKQERTPSVSFLHVDKLSGAGTPKAPSDEYTVSKAD